MSPADNLILAEKYRPKTLDECILPEKTKNDLHAAIDSGNVPNIVMYGPPGTGKTSACRAIANDIGADLLYLNASLERNIDTIRNQVVSFSSSVSFGGGLKIVLLDEFDGMTLLQQNAMKGVVEEFPNARFFFTSNHINKIIEPIRSRCVNIDFKIDNKSKADVAAKFFKRVIQILQKENIEFEKPVVAELIKKHFPDFRRTLNEIQRCSASGKIDVSVLADHSVETFNTLFEAVKNKDYYTVRRWIGANSDVEPHILFREIYDRAEELIDPSTVKNLIVILSDYQFKAAHSVDPEILLSAFFVEMMNVVTWKK